MSYLRRGLYWTVALVWAVLATPSYADPPPNKLFSFTMCVGTLDQTQPNNCALGQAEGDGSQQLVATIFNQSPAGSNASFSSIDLSIDLDWTILNDANDVVTVIGGGTNWNADTTSKPGHLLITNLSPVKPKATLIVAFFVSSFSCGDGTWSLTPWTGSNIGGFPFAQDLKNASSPASGVSCGLFACNAPITIEPAAGVCDANANDPDCLKGNRSFYNKNGTSNGNGCNSVDVFVTNNLATPAALLHVRWQNEPTAAFAYRVNADSAPTWKVSWLPTSGTPVFITAPNCAVMAVNPPADLPFPAPYGKLAADITKTSNKLQIAVGGTLPTVGASIIVDTERMLVTNVNANQLTVSIKRGQGGTTAAPHFAPASVMSTPLPILTNDYTGAQYSFPNGSDQATAGYAVNLQAQMCLASATHDNGDGTFSVWIFDIGDGLTHP